MQIYLANKNTYALIDDGDYNLVKEYKWYLDDMGYARSSSNKQNIRLHQLVFGKASKGMVIDHINQNRLDNRKENLRYLPHRSNLINSGAPVNNTSGIRGVRWDKSRNKWIAYIGMGERHYVKIFNQLEQAIAWRKDKENAYFYS